MDDDHHRTIEEVNAGWQANYQNAWAGLRMIREAVETLGPPGILPSETAVLGRYGPEPVHEAAAIVAALRKAFVHGAHNG